MAVRLLRQVLMESPKKPLIAVIGTTGVGKSSLAIDLALSLRSSPVQSWVGARVINADAMQVYRGVDVITNKVTEDEMKGVEHYLLGFKELGEEYVIGEWVHDTTMLIDEAHAQNQCPIIVGGTTYWIQHLLFPNRLPSLDTLSLKEDSSGTERAPCPELDNAIAQLPQNLRELFQSLPSRPPSASDNPNLAFSLYSLLSRLDPVMAARWHWKDTRKVLRNIKLIKEHNRKASDIMSDQGELAVSPKYDTLIYWLYADPDVLHHRLDTRVDHMLQHGLLEDIRTLHDLKLKLASQTPEQVKNTGFTEGIFQVIGYKEFYDYLLLSEPPNALFDTSLEVMKQATRKYAQYQLRWIRQRIVPAIKDVNQNLTPMPLILLDATDISGWPSIVQGPANNIMREFLAGSAISSLPPLSLFGKDLLIVNKAVIDPPAILIARRKRSCPECSQDVDRPVLLEEGEEWDRHIKGRTHRRQVAKNRKAETLREKGSLRQEPIRVKIKAEPIDLEGVGSIQNLFEVPS